MVSDLKRWRDHSSQFPTVSESLRLVGHDGRPARVSCLTMGVCSWGVVIMMVLRSLRVAMDWGMVQRGGGSAL
jgi:hypothetical protein